MNWPILHRWLTVGSLGSALLAGCKDTEKRSACSQPDQLRAVVSAPVSKPLVGTPAQRITVPPSNPAPALARLAAAVPPRPVQLSLEDAPTITAEEPPPPEPVKVESPPVPLSLAKFKADLIESTSPQMALTESSLPHGKPPADSKPAVHSRFGHDEAYRWLSGQLRYSLVSKSWRLRYAAVDEEDRYGGSVTLEEDKQLEGVKDGQYVRVQGCLSGPAERIIAPLYRIESLELVETAGPEVK